MALLEASILILTQIYFELCFEAPKTLFLVFIRREVILIVNDD